MVDHTTDNSDPTTTSDRSGSPELPDEVSGLEAQMLLNTGPTRDAWGQQERPKTADGRQERPKTADGGRTYRCLGCGEIYETFCRACPGCNARSFATVTAGERGESSGPVDELLATYARLTAPYNPYIPR